MVGYYQSEPISGRSQSPQMATLEASMGGIKPVKSLVCSPDLSVYASPTSERLESSTEEKSYQCVLCQKSFELKNLYQNHLRTHGKEGEDPYRCNICGKTFAVPARLTRHYRTHTGEKPYQCEVCSKSFSVKENLSVHRRIHTKERPYKCDVCERAFEHSGKLHRHMRIHTGERPHKCSVCEKTFIQSGQLVIHMRTHTGEKPYVCKECGKGFTCSKQLKVHTRTHTGEKPYTCDICGKSFGYNHVLKLHQVAHYGEKVYKCTLCHETFNSKKTMELHIKTHSDSGAATSRDSPIEPVIEISPTVNLEANSVTNSPVSSSDACSVISTSSSDKENKTDDGIYMPSKDISYYFYSREQQYSQSNPHGTNPALLAVATAVVTDDRPLYPQHVPTVPSSDPAHPLFHYPEMSYCSYSIQANDGISSDCSSLLNLPGNDARRRVEAALEAVEEQRRGEYAGIMGVINRQPILTPPSSNPVSPAPSPDPLDLAIPAMRETLILPPRKRCKMILQSMESERTELAAQRHSSVIQFARTS